MASNTPLIETLVAVAIGAVIGFLGSIGLDWWKQGEDKKELKNRIREELEIILLEATSDYEKEAFQSRAFRIEAFLALKQDLIRKLDAKTFRAIQDVYIEIEKLRFPSNLQDENKKRYKETLEAVRKVIDILK